MKELPLQIRPKWIRDLVKVADEANKQYLARRPIEDRKEFDAIIHLISYAQASEHLLPEYKGIYK